MQVVQNASPMALFFPASQSAHCVDPVEAVILPPSQSMHAVPAVLLMAFPAGHRVQDAAAATAAYDPLSQSKQLLCPVAGCDVPAAQALHVIEPVPLET